MLGALTHWAPEEMGGSWGSWSGMRALLAGRAGLPLPEAAAGLSYMPGPSWPRLSKT